MTSLTIRGARLREYSSYSDNGGKQVLEMKFRADWSDPVCETMKWDKKFEGGKTVPLERSLIGVNMILEPNDAKLKDYRMDIPITKVDKFKSIAEIEDGEVSGRELEFIVTAHPGDETTILAVWRYDSVCGGAELAGQMKINHIEEKQGELPLGQDAAPAETPAPEPVRGRKRAAAEGVQ